MLQIDSVEDVQKVNLWFRTGDWKKLQAIARQTDTPVSALVRRIVREWLQKQKKPR
jgi:hypothetical protein